MGTGAHVINAGTISPGQLGRGVGTTDVNAANAVDIVGNNNTFEIWNSSVIKGNVVVKSGTVGNTLALGGAANGTFDVSAIGNQYKGFQGYSKTDVSVWTF
ncbi:hypothetical protein AVM02_09495 [Brucella anthropi]